MRKTEIMRQVLTKLFAHGITALQNGGRGRWGSFGAAEHGNGLQPHVVAEADEAVQGGIGVRGGGGPGGRGG